MINNILSAPRFWIEVPTSIFDDMSWGGIIITIIVLLILAGVTLNMVMGENGIIEKARIAKEKTNESQEQEMENLQSLENACQQV